jgi:aminomethyltransferase
VTVLKRTPLYEAHVALGGKMVDFAGWEMPLMYPSGVVAEHLATRRRAGLFDVSHMGRLCISGPSVLGALQYALSNNVAALEVGQAQYTFIPTPTGGAVDDAYLYRFFPHEYLLVINAANRRGDIAVLEERLGREALSPPSAPVPQPAVFPVTIEDRTDALAMLSLQGPQSRDILSVALTEGTLPEPRRNELSVAHIGEVPVLLGRTGYTGEPLCFELFLPAEHARPVWDLLVKKGAVPCGLGARDTLRLEAGLPLYGHELGVDPDGNEIPIFSSPLAQFAVSFSPAKGDFVGREALVAQQAAYRRVLAGDLSDLAALPRITRPVALAGRGVGRAGAPVLRPDGRTAGWVTSGTMVPYWKTIGEKLESHPGNEYELRPIGLALLESDLRDGDEVQIDIRGHLTPAVVTPYHLRGDAPPYARPIVFRPPEEDRPLPLPRARAHLADLVDRAVANHRRRQEECINLIPSEMTPSPLVRLLSVTDPAFRYAEHRELEAFPDTDIFYYQGTGFIDEVEQALERELRRFLGAAAVETRVISGQMANAALFSALMDYRNRWNRKAEPERLRMVMNNHIGKGGHLSAQPMGALKDFVAMDPLTDRPAVVGFPVLPGDRYRIDVAATLELIERHRPELIILGKSMVLYKEPLADIRRCVDELGLDSVIMYDMAHVLGLVGPHFQQPFAEGADFVTGSTHKTFFGTQRGIIAGRFRERDEDYDLWQTAQRRTFPGSVSNHHLGTMLGLLAATYEMNEFRDAYQTAVIANAKAFARALAAEGLRVAGDPAIGHTETHQVIVEVGYGRGPLLAERLEANNIICNYQAAPDEEGFTAAGALRLGVAEMTRFGMGQAEFQALAGLMAGIILEDRTAKNDVSDLRRGFRQLRYCVGDRDIPEAMKALRETLED